MSIAFSDKFSSKLTGIAAGGPAFLNSPSPELPQNKRLLSQPEKARVRAMLEKDFAYNSNAGFYKGKAFIDFLAQAYQFNPSKGKGVFIKGGGSRNILFSTPFSGKDLDISFGMEELGGADRWNCFRDDFVNVVAAGRGLSGQNILDRGLNGKFFDDKGRSFLFQLPIEITGVASSVDIDFAVMKAPNQFVRTHSCDSSHGSFYIDIEPVLKAFVSNDKNCWDQEMSVIAMDGYGLEKSLTLTANKRFYIAQGAGKTLFQGVRKYCDHLTKGLIADSQLMNIPETEKDFCQTVIDKISVMPLDTVAKELGLEKYLDEHYKSDIPAKVLYLLNYHDIFQRSNKSSPKLDHIICNLLTQFLNLPRPPSNHNEALRQCKAYLYLAYGDGQQSENFKTSSGGKANFLVCESAEGLRTKRGFVAEASLASVQKDLAVTTPANAPLLEAFRAQFALAKDVSAQVSRHKIAKFNSSKQHDAYKLVEGVLKNIPAFVEHFEELSKHTEEVATQLLFLMRTQPEGLAKLHESGRKNLANQIVGLLTSLMKKKKTFRVEEIFKVLLEKTSLLSREQIKDIASRLIPSLVSQKQQPAIGFKRALGIYELLLGKGLDSPFLGRIEGNIVDALPGKEAGDYKRLLGLLKDCSQEKIVRGFALKLQMHHALLLEDPVVQASPLFKLMRQESKSEEVDLLPDLLSKLSIAHEKKAPADLASIVRSAFTLPEKEFRSFHDSLCAQEASLIESLANAEDTKTYLQELYVRHLEFLQKIAPQFNSVEDIIPWPVEEAYSLMKSAQFPQHLLLNFWTLFSSLMFSHPSRAKFLYETYKQFPQSKIQDKLLATLVEKLAATFSKLGLDDFESVYPFYSLAIQMILDEKTDTPRLQSAFVNMIAKFLTISVRNLDGVLARTSIDQKTGLRDRVSALQLKLKSNSSDKTKQKKGQQAASPLDEGIQKHPIFKYWGAVVMGDQAFNSGNWNEALQHYQRALSALPKSEPSNEIDLRDKIVVCISKDPKKDVKAKIQESFDKLSAIKGDQDWNRQLAVVFNNFGDILFFKGHYKDAEKMELCALELDPNNTKAHELLGESYAAQGMYENSRKHFRLYLAKHPDDSFALTNFGHTLTKLKCYKEAALTFRKAALHCTSKCYELTAIQVAFPKAIDPAIEEAPEDKELWHLRAQFNLRYNAPINTNSVLEDVLIALLLDPDYVDAQSLLESVMGKIKTDEKKNEETVPDLVKTLDDAEKLLKEQKWTRAIPLYVSVLNLPDCPAYAWHNLGVAYSELGKIQDAAIVLLQGSGKFPDAATQLLKKLALIYSTCGMNEKIMLVCEKMAKLNSDDPILRQNLVQLYLKIHANVGRSYDLKRAKVHAEACKNIDPKESSAWYWLGVISYEYKFFREAVEHYEKSLKLNPSLTPELYGKLSEAYFKVGRQSDGIAILEKGALAFPNNVQMKEYKETLQKGIAAAAEKKKPAEVEKKNSEEPSPEDLDIDLKGAKRKIKEALKEDNYAEMIRYGNIAIRLDPDCGPVVWNNLGSAYIATAVPAGNFSRVSKIFLS